MMRRLTKPSPDGQPAPAGASPADPPAGDPPTPKPPEHPADPPAPEPGKTFTQAELDAIVKREKAKQERSTKDEAAEAARVAALSETDRLKAEKEAADARTQSAVAKGNAALVQADAKLAAVVAGASVEKAPLVLRLANLSDIDVTDDVPDADAIRAAIEKVKAEVPELFGAAAGSGRSGGDFQGGSSGKRVWTRAEIAALAGTPEFDGHKDDINLAASEGRIKG